MKIGQLCIKTAGRDGGQFAVIVENVDDTFVLIDGNVRRKKCNTAHLEPLDKVLKIKEGASTSEVEKALESEGIKIVKKGEKRTPSERPRKIRKSKKTTEKKKVKKTAAKEVKKAEK